MAVEVTPNPDLIASIYSPPQAEKPWRLEDFLPGCELRYFSFARRALAAGLAARGFSGRTPTTLGGGISSPYGSVSRARVLLPEFICRDLLSALFAAGAEPVFYPVGPDLNPVQEPGLWPQTQAVIAVNYFGFPQDLSPFRAYAARTGAVLIEDNAHGLFSRDAQGAFLGARGDIGLFSLRKTMPIPNSAALALRQGEHAWRIPEQAPFQTGHAARMRLKKTLRFLARTSGAPSAFRVLTALRGARRLLRGSALPGPDPESEVRLPFPERPDICLSKPLREADPALEVVRRRSLYSLLEDRLRRAGFLPVFSSLPPNVAPYGFPFRVPPGQLSRARGELATIGLEPLPWPDLPAAVAPRAPAHYRDVWIAHFLW